MRIEEMPLSHRAKAALADYGVSDVAGMMALTYSDFLAIGRTPNVGAVTLNEIKAATKAAIKEESLKSESQKFVERFPARLIKNAAAAIKRDHPNISISLTTAEGIARTVMESAFATIGSVIFERKT